MASRRLSLTLLLVAPLITAQDYEDVQTQEPLSAVSGEHLPVGNNNPNRVQQEVLDPWSPGDTTERSVETTSGATELRRRRGDDGEDVEPLSAVSGEHLPVGNSNHNRVQQDVLDPWSPGDTTERSVETTSGATELRRLKRDDGEDMETAEQILSRPIFRHQQMIADRLERQRQRKADRRYTQGSDFGAPAQLQSAQNRLPPSILDVDDQNQIQYRNAKYASLIVPRTSERPLRPVLV